MCPYRIARTKVSYGSYMRAESVAVRNALLGVGNAKTQQRKQ